MMLEFDIGKAMRITVNNGDHIIWTLDRHHIYGTGRAQYPWHGIPLELGHQMARMPSVRRKDADIVSYKEGS